MKVLKRERRDELRRGGELDLEMLRLNKLEFRAALKKHRMVKKRRRRRVAQKEKRRAMRENASQLKLGNMQFSQHLPGFDNSCCLVKFYFFKFFKFFTFSTLKLPTRIFRLPWPCDPQ